MKGRIVTKEITFKLINLRTLHAFSRGKEQFVLRMLEAILNSIETIVPQIDSAIQRHDIVSVNINSHKLVPNMNMIGHYQLENAIRRLETITSDGRSNSEINNLWQTTRKMIIESLSELKAAREFYNRRVQNG